MIFKFLVNIKQILQKNSAQVARGKDNFNCHEKIPRNKSLMNKDDIKLKKKENDYLQKIFYNGSSKKDSY